MTSQTLILLDLILCSPPICQTSQPNIDENVRAVQEARLAELLREQEEKKRAAIERKLALRYHKVRFFERVKIERRLKRLRRQQKAFIRGDDSAEPLTDAEEEELKRLEEDLQYVLHFPKGEKYVSILKNAENPEAQEHLEAERSRLRAQVKRNLAEIALVAEPDEGKHLVGELQDASARTSPATNSEDPKTDRRKESANSYNGNMSVGRFESSDAEQRGLGTSVRGDTTGDADDDFFLDFDEHKATVCHADDNGGDSESEDQNASGYGGLDDSMDGDESDCSSIATDTSAAEDGKTDDFFAADSGLSSHESESEIDDKDSIDSGRNNGLLEPSKRRNAEEGFRSSLQRFDATRNHQEEFLIRAPNRSGSKPHDLMSDGTRGGKKSLDSNHELEQPGGSMEKRVAVRVLSGSASRREMKAPLPKEKRKFGPTSDQLSILKISGVGVERKRRKGITNKKKPSSQGLARHGGKQPLRTRAEGGRKRRKKK